MFIWNNVWEMRVLLATRALSSLDCHYWNWLPLFCRHIVGSLDWLRCIQNEKNRIGMCTYTDTDTHTLYLLLIVVYLLMISIVEIFRRVTVTKSKQENILSASKAILFFLHIFRFLCSANQWVAVVSREQVWLYSQSSTIVWRWETMVFDLHDWFDWTIAIEKKEEVCAFFLLVVPRNFKLLEELEAAQKGHHEG